MGVRPATGSAARRTRATITGCGFEAVAKVRCEGAQAAGIEPPSDFTVDSDRKFAAIVPPGTAATASGNARATVASESFSFLNRHKE